MICYILRDRLSLLYKIGQSKNVERRLATLSTGNINLDLLFTLHFVTEKYLHKIFKSKRVSKEWFDLTLNDLSEVLDLEDDLFKHSL